MDVGSEKYLRIYKIRNFETFYSFPIGKNGSYLNSPLQRNVSGINVILLGEKAIFCIPF